MVLGCLVTVCIVPIPAMLWTSPGPWCLNPAFWATAAAWLWVSMAEVTLVGTPLYWFVQAGLLLLGSAKSNMKIQDLTK